MGALAFLLLAVLLYFLWKKVSSLNKSVTELKLAMAGLKQTIAELSAAGEKAVAPEMGEPVAAVPALPESTAMAGQPPSTGEEIQIEEDPAAAWPPAAAVLTSKGVPTRVLASGTPSPETEPLAAAHRESSARADDPELIIWLRKLFTGENLLVKVGVVILFFGMAFLVKYAAEHGFLPPEIRLILAAVTGMTLIALGWLFRSRRAVYGQILQGGGIGIVYLTVFTAFRLYQFIPSEMAFILLIVITFCSGVMAVLQDSRPLAFWGIVGAFLAPFLVSTGKGNHIVLFSYYALLDACICAIAWFKAWRELNVLGFIFTFGLGAVWGGSSYHSELFASTELFLILYFLMFVFVAVLFPLRQTGNLKGYVDGTIVFGTPVLAFAVQSFLVKPYPNALAWSAVAAGSFYILLAWVLFRKGRQELRLLNEAFVAFGVIFITLAIPLALTERWTSAVWALEGAGIVWIGVRQNRRLSRLFGVLLQALSWLFFLTAIKDITGDAAVFNGVFLGGLLISLAAVASAYFYNRYDDQAGGSPEVILEIILFVVGFMTWFSNGIHEIHIRLPETHFVGISLIFLALSCGVCSYLKKRIPWTLLLYPSLVLLPAMTLLLLTGIADDMKHPFEGWGYLGWFISFAVQYLILYQQRGHERLPFMSAYHCISYLLLAAICAWELNWAVEQVVSGGTVWAQVMWGLIPAVFLYALSIRTVQDMWPISTGRQTYVSHTAGIILCYVVCWIIYSGFGYTGNPDPLPYLPFLNPLDCAIMLGLAAIVLWFLRLDADGKAFIKNSERLLAGIFALLIFYWLNTTLLRTLHFWAHVDYDLGSMFRSILVQTSLSIFWTAVAVSVILWASRRKVFEVWIGGGFLLGVVVLKLFVIDLSKSNTVERIVSFVVVGILLLLVGYFSPLPPQKKGIRNE